MQEVMTVKEDTPTERFLKWCDEHQTWILNLNLAIFAAAAVFLFTFGADETTEEFRIRSTVFPLIIFLSGYYQSKVCSEEHKRLLTFIFLVYLVCSVNLLAATVFLSFYTLPDEVSFIVIIPMAIFAIIMGIKVFPPAFKKAGNDIKLFIKYFIKR
jgi:hypothetical protein